MFRSCSKGTQMEHRKWNKRRPWPPPPLRPSVPRKQPINTVSNGFLTSRKDSALFTFVFDRGQALGDSAEIEWKCFIFMLKKKSSAAGSAGARGGQILNRSRRLLILSAASTPLRLRHRRRFHSCQINFNRTHWPWCLLRPSRFCHLASFWRVSTLLRCWLV